MLNSQKINELALSVGLTPSGNFWISKSKNGEIKLSLAGDAVKGVFKQVDGYSDTIFFNEGELKSLLVWAEFYKRNTITQFGTIGWNG